MDFLNSAPGLCTENSGKHIRKQPRPIASISLLQNCNSFLFSDNEIETVLIAQGYRVHLPHATRDLRNVTSE